MLTPIRYILRHPLNRNRRSKALLEFVRWQLSTRILRAPVAVPFVDQSRLLVSRGMTGATANIYGGLHDPAEMGLLLHLLRKGDVFADIGANVGEYTVLAAAVCQTESFAFEPIPSTFEHLLDNIYINRISDRVHAHCIGISNTPGTLRFTSNLDTVNHIVSDQEQCQDVTEVPVRTLDSALNGKVPTLMKIDVEGFETNVIAGAHQTLKSPSLLAMIIELNGSGERYGFDENKLHQAILEFGFITVDYDPFQRKLSPRPGNTRPEDQGNTIYVRSIESLAARIKSAPTYTVSRFRTI